MRRLVVAASGVVLSVGLLAGCSASVSVGTDPSPTGDVATDGAVSLTETLVNDQHGFSFGYAPPFEPQDDATFDSGSGSESTDTSAVFDTEGSQIDGQYRDAFVVNVYQLTREVTEADLPAAKAEIENTLIPQLKQSTPGIQFTPVTETTLADKPAFRTDASFDVNGQPIESTMYFIFDGNTQYQVLVQAAEKNWDSLQPTFDAMLQSLTIYGSSASPTGA